MTSTTKMSIPRVAKYCLFYYVDGRLFIL